MSLYMSICIDLYILMCRYGNKHTDDLYSHGVQMMPIYMLHDEKVLFEATANQAACAYIYI